MSIRYGIELVFDPVFTAGVYRLRQFVCGQFGCWAAEMHMLRMQVVPYFECPEEGLPSLDQEVAQVASGIRSRSPAPEVGWNGISEDGESGSVFLDISEVNGTLTDLYHSAIDAVSRGHRVSSPRFRQELHTAHSPSRIRRSASRHTGRRYRVRPWRSFGVDAACHG